MQIFPVLPPIGIADDNLLEVDDADAADDDYAKFTANGLEGRDYSEVRTDLGLVIGTNVQAHGDVLDDLNTLGAAASDGQFIVATGAGAFAYEKDAVARNSLTLGTTDTVQFGTTTVLGLSATDITARTTGVQLVLEYDGSNFTSFHTESDGDLTLNSNKAGYTLDFTDAVLTTSESLVIGDGKTIGSTSDTDAIAIASDGKTTFTQDLTVNEDIIIGDAKYIGSASDPDSAQIEADGDWVLTQGMTVTNFLVVDSPTLVVNASGYANKVGIGTATPDEALHVYSASDHAKIVAEAGAGKNSSFTVKNALGRSGLVQFWEDSERIWMFEALESVGFSVSEADHPYTVWTRRLLIPPGGSMELLAGAGENAIFKCKNALGRTGSVQFWEDSERTWQFGSLESQGFFIEEADHPYTVWTRRLAVEPGGNVGIGEAAPQDKLEVNGTVLVKDALKFTQDDGNEYIDSLNDGYLDYGATTGHRFNAETVISGEVEAGGATTKIKLTSLGGYAIKLTNKTGGNTVAGQLVIASNPGGADTDDAFETAGASSANTIGITLDAGVADGSEAWVVVSGIADVLIDGGGSIRGDRLISSATAGSADVWNVGGAVATHFQEIGHCIETRVGAGLARCVLHFN